MRLLLSDYCKMSPEEQEAALAEIVHEARMQERAKFVELIDERIAAYFASVSKSEAAARSAFFADYNAAHTDYRAYLRDRDEPPAVPPMRVINTTERL